LYPNWDDPLLPLLAAYHAAVIRSDGLQAKLKAAVGDEDLLDRSLVAAEQVIEARAAGTRGARRDAGAGDARGGVPGRLLPLAVHGAGRAVARAAGTPAGPLGRGAAAPRHGRARPLVLS
jgi:hypothetical protein